MELSQIIGSYLTKENTKVRYIGETRKIPLCLMSIICIKGTCINLGRQTEETHEIILKKGCIGELIFVSDEANIFFSDLKNEANKVCNNSKNKGYLYIREDAYLFPIITMLELIVKI